MTCSAGGASNARECSLYAFAVGRRSRCAVTVAASSNLQPYLAACDAGALFDTYLGIPMPCDVLSFESCDVVTRRRARRRLVLPPKKPA